MHISIDIDAPIQVAWQALTDLERYPEWNPMIPRVEGQLTTGATLMLTVDLGFRRTQAQRVLEFEPHTLSWTGGIGRLVYGIRTQRLVATSATSCRYTSDESMNGPLAGLTLLLLRRRLMRGFQASAEALKQHCERRLD